jgi:apolipoprotein N-acyltransferase
MIPLLQAADMSGWWFLGFFVPVLGFVAWILWSLNIAKTRGKGIWTAILLILPPTSFFAFLYLAFSSEAPSDTPVRKYKSMALETA